MRRVDAILEGEPADKIAAFATGRREDVRRRQVRSRRFLVAHVARFRHGTDFANLRRSQIRGRCSKTVGNGREADEVLTVELYPARISRFGARFAGVPVSEEPAGKTAWRIVPLVDQKIASRRLKSPVRSARWLSRPACPPKLEL